MTHPDPALVLDLIEAFRRSKTMFAAVSLGVFDLLADRPADLVSLAGRLDANAAALERLLDGCVALGLLSRTEAGYANTAEADTYLRRDSDHTLAGYINYSDTALFPMWAHLGDAVREGSHRWHQTFGPGDDLFSNFFRTDEGMRDFLRGMHGLGLLTSPAVTTAFNLGRFRRLVDLGGATGHLAIEARRRYPQLDCAVFDLPRVIDVAREFVKQADVDVELIAGDFFSDPLPPADLYCLGRILHDWSEEKIIRLLGKIHDSLPPGGSVLICEKLLNDDKSGPVSAAMQSLNMLICTEGRERTLAEYTDLLHRTGFSDVKAERTATPLDVILATRAEQN